MRLPLIIITLGLAFQSEAKETLLVAVASNFVETLRPIAQEFSEARDVDVRLSAGSTGKLYAQIRNGAPFDVFLSADEERTLLLVEQGRSVEAETRLYAIGHLMLWSADPATRVSDCLSALEADAGARIAIANPKTAPYGRAAMEFLASIIPNADLDGRLLVGENIAQAAQFAALGGARFGLLALSQRDRLPDAACVATVPAESHAPIEQHAVALRGGNEVLALEFLDYLTGDAQAAIEAAGYTVPASE